jgi:hypothetical protein
MQSYKIQFFLKDKLFNFLTIYNKYIIKKKNLRFKINKTKNFFSIEAFLNLFNLNLILEKILVKKFNKKLDFQKKKSSKSISFFLDDFKFLKKFLSNNKIKNKIFLVNQKLEIVNLDLNFPFYFTDKKIKLKLFLLNSFDEKKNTLSGYFFHDIYIYNNKSYYQNIIEIINYISIKQFSEINQHKNYSMSLKLYDKKNTPYFFMFKIFFSALIRKLFLTQKIEQYKNKGKWKTFLVKDKECIKQIVDDQDNFLADPFLISFKKNQYIFCEDFTYDKNIGKISSYQIKKDGLIKSQNILNNKKHMSFPFLIKYKSNVYICPESSSYNDIRLYKATTFPKKWKLKKKIIQNINAVDSIIFYKDKNWWIITSINLNVSSSYQNYMMIFYSKNLFSQNWYEHSMNPILCDNGNARNAGFLVNNKDVFRISQKIKNNFYGALINVNKITKLNKDTFKENNLIQFDKNLKFLKKNYLIGIHHLNKLNNSYVFDAYQKNN